MMISTMGICTYGGDAGCMITDIEKVMGLDVRSGH
jgi:hypothetical protein